MKIYLKKHEHLKTSEGFTSRTNLSTLDRSGILSNNQSQPLLCKKKTGKTSILRSFACLIIIMSGILDR
jgi:hypothetical protein